jgi:hypothetical protein
MPFAAPAQPHASASDALIPFVIGVTGHRNPDPATVAQLESEVEGILRRLDSLAPNTPFVLLSPLARGCDRIAARVAMRFRRRVPGMEVRVLAPLPLPLDDYRRDFAGDPGDSAEFEDLLCKVDEHFELPLPDGLERDSAHRGVAGASRDQCYRRLGLYVAVQSQLVIGLWDGIRTGKVGGTGEVVEFCRGTRPHDLDAGLVGIPFRQTTYLLAPPDRTPLAWIPTRRESSPAPAAAATGDAWVAEVRGLLTSLEDLNGRLGRAGRGYGSKLLQAPPPPVVARAWSRLETRFRTLDALGSAQKKWIQRGAVAIPATFVLAIVAFQWFAGFGSKDAEHAWIPLMVYVLLLLVASILWWALKVRHRIEWSFVHARALAEAMRVELAWAGSGVAQVAPDLYAARRSEDVEQLRLLLRAATIESSVVRARGGAGGWDVRGKPWVEEQDAYFSGKNIERRRCRTAAVRVLGLCLKGSVGLLSAVLLVVALVAALGRAEVDVDHWAVVLCFAVAVALACSVGLSYWQHVTLDGEDIESAERMVPVFRRAKELLGEDPDSALRVIDAAGREALDEHAEWFVRHRDKLRMPELG